MHSSSSLTLGLDLNWKWNEEVLGLESCHEDQSVCPQYSLGLLNPFVTIKQFNVFHVNIWLIEVKIVFERFWATFGCHEVLIINHNEPCWVDDNDLLVLVGKWADPGGTAMPGQPATRPEQAPEPHPLAKISLISKGAHGPRIRY